MGNAVTVKNPELILVVRFGHGKLKGSRSQKIAPLPYKSVGYHAGLSSRILYVDRDQLQVPTKRAETP